MTTSSWWSISKRNIGWVGNLERRVMLWLHDRFLERLLRRYGGIQQCPWCKQCAQAFDGSRFDSTTDPTIDALHCGNCGGTSRWRFEMGMMPLQPIGLAPPPVDRPDRDDPGIISVQVPIQ